MVRNASRKLKARLPGGGGDAGLVFAELASELRTQAALQVSPGMKSASLWLKPESAALCENWLAGTNLNQSIGQQQTYTTLLHACAQRLCHCLQTDGKEQCPVHTPRSMSLSDLLWILTDYVFEHVAICVPHLAMAVLMRIASDESGSCEDVPSYCHFLGRTNKYKAVQDSCNN